MAAGSTNAQQWNPNASNQETDAQYTADSQRAQGAQNTSIFLSITANKMFYQLSTYLTALFQAFADKGFTTSDSNLNTLTAVCANFLTSVDVRSGLTVLAYAPNIALNIAQTVGYVIALAGNTAIGSVTGYAPGQLLLMVYQQNGTGGYTVAYPAGDFVGAVQPDPAPNTYSAQLFYVGSAGYPIQALGPMVSSTGMMLFNSASFNGSVNVTGTLTATMLTANTENLTTLNVSGLATVGGINTGTINAGTVSASGTITAVSLVATGNASVAGTLSTGAITTGSELVTGNLNVGSLQLGGTAPNGLVLTGNGVTYAPRALPVQTPPVLAYGGNLANSSRYFNTTYTNTSGSPIYVTGYGNTSGSSVGGMNAIVNGATIWSCSYTSTVSNGQAGFTVMVPAGATYSIVPTGAINGLVAWYEGVLS